MSTLMDIAKEMQQQNDERSTAPMGGGQRKRSSSQQLFDGTVIVSIIYALLAALYMIVVNPERTRDESVPCPVQNMQHVMVVAAAAFAVTYVVININMAD